MFRKSAVFLCIALVLVSGNADNASPVPGIMKPDAPLYPGAKLEPEPRLETTTASSASTTSTTPITSTTSTTAKTTTTPTSTTPPPTTTTTPAPTTSTPKPPPSTTKPPNVIPKPTDMYVLNEANHTCIMMQMTVQMSIVYNTTLNKTMTQLLALPFSNETTIKGSCGNAEQLMIISWNLTSSLNNSLTLNFVKNETKNSYWLKNLTVSIDPRNLNNSNSNVSLIYVYAHDQFSVKLNNSYLCLREQKVVLTPQGSSVTAGFVKINGLQLQAFMNTKSDKFGLAHECPFDTPDYVPITVGCALAGFIVIILVVYLVSRRRSQARGYLSM